jgi:hypothetical protein
MPPADPFGALAAVLEDERQALLAGDLDRLPALLLRKQSLAERLGAAVPPAPALAGLRAAAVRNARLLAAARAGLDGALERVAALRGGGAAGFDSYDARGRPARVTARDVRLERRA